MTAPVAIFDHLVVAGVTLAQSIEWFADLTGVSARPSGQHVRMGTHNALAKLGERAFVELIAIDPSLPKPARPRWFDMDNAKLALTLGEQPRLVNWAARTTDLDGLLARANHDAGTAMSMARGDFKWRITVPDDGHRPGDGVLPTLLQWDVPEHPADSLPDHGMALEQLAASHPEPEEIRASLKPLGLGETLRVTYDSSPRLAAMLRTPRGLVTL